MVHVVALTPLVLMAIWFLLYRRFGAPLWIRVYLYAVVLLLFIPFFIKHGLGGILFFAVVFLGLFIFLVSRKLASMRMPLESNLLAVEEIQWPDYARERAFSFANQVRDSGLFTGIYNCTRQARVGKKTITELCIVAMNREGNAWIRFGTNDNGEKRFTYVVHSVAQDGKDLLTSNRILNGHLFSDPMFRSAHCPETGSIAPYMEKHLELCRNNGPIRAFDEDVVTVMKKLSRVWTDRMLDAGNLELTSGGMEVRITSQALFGVALRSLKGLFV